MKRINLLWTDDKDVHYPTDVPNQFHVESLGRGKTCLIFLNLGLKVWLAKIAPPRMSRGMSEYLGPTLI